MVDDNNDPFLLAVLRSAIFTASAFPVPRTWLGWPIAPEETAMSTEPPPGASVNTVTRSCPDSGNGVMSPAAMVYLQSLQLGLGVQIYRQPGQFNIRHIARGAGWLFLRQPCRVDLNLELAFFLCCGTASAGNAAELAETI